MQQEHIEIAPQRRPRSRRLWLRTAALSALILALVAYLGISAIAATVLTTPRRSFTPEASPAALGLPFRDVQFAARGDGVPIAGWFLPAQSKAAVIMVHGKDSSRTNEFGGQFVHLAGALQQHGLNVLMIDMRGHGQSGEAHFSFGPNERQDVLGAVDWLRGQGFQPGRIGVLGVSMGAAASMLAAADDPAIGALMEDCGYATIKPIIEHEWSSASGLPGIFLPSTILMSQVLYGIDLGAARPVDQIGRMAGRQVLIIHGTSDTLVPPENATELAAALPTAHVWLVAGAAHARSYNHDPEAYQQRVTTFFRNALAQE